MPVRTSNSIPNFNVSTRILELAGALAKNSRCLVCAGNDNLLKIPTEPSVPTVAPKVEFGSLTIFSQFYFFFKKKKGTLPCLFKT